MSSRLCQLKLPLVYAIHGIADMECNAIPFISGHIRVSTCKMFCIKIVHPLQLSEEFMLVKLSRAI